MTSDKRVALLLVALIFLSWAKADASTPIGDIQAYDPVTGAPDSPYLSQTVTVSGVVTSGSGVVADDVLYLQDDSGGILLHLPGFAARRGDFLAVTGVVAHGGGASSEVRVDAAYWGPLGFSVTPAPAVLTLADAGSDYENIGLLARVGGHVATLETTGFTLTDGIDSLFVEVTTGSGISLAEVALTDTFTVVGTLGHDDGTVRIRPRDQHDLSEGDTYDDIRVASISCDNWAPEPGESWTMSFVVEASTPPEQLVFRYRYVEAGPEWTTLTWTPPRGMKGVYPTDFIGASYGTPSEVEWDLGESNWETASLISTQSFYNGTVPIDEIQEVDVCDPDLSSPWVGRAVNFEGIAVTSETGRAVVMMPNSGAKGVYPTDFVGASYGTPSEVEWPLGGSSISTTISPLYTGDEVRIGGHVYEINGLTIVAPITFDSAYLISFANDLPVADVVPTGVLGDNVQDGDCVQGEAFESVRVRPQTPVVVDVSSFAVDGTYLIASGGVLADAITVRHSTSLTYVPAVGDLLDVAGYMDVRGGQYELVVGSNYDIEVVGAYYGGLACTPIGDATLDYHAGPPDTLVVTGLGSAEDDGVSLDLTDAIPEGTMFGPAVEFDAVVGSWLEGRAYGLAGGSEELVLTSRTTVVSDTVHVTRMDFSPAQSSGIQAVVMENGEPVSWISGLPGVIDLRHVGTFTCAAPMFVYDLKTNEDGKTVFSALSDTVPVEVLALVTPEGEDLLTLGPGTYAVDFALMSPTLPLEGWTRVEIRGNLPQFSIVGQVALPEPPFDVAFDGFTHVPTGRTSLSLVDDVLAWEQIGEPALGGFQVDLEGRIAPHSIFTAAVAFDAAVGQVLAASPTGVVLGSHVTPGSLRLEVATDSTQTWTVDLSSLGCQTVAACVSSGAVVTRQETGLPSRLVLDVWNPATGPLDVKIGVGRSSQGRVGLWIDSDMLEAQVRTESGTPLFTLGAGRQAIYFQAQDALFPVDELLLVDVGCSPDLHSLSVVGESLIPVPISTAVEPPPDLAPTVAGILSVSPNPFNPATEIAFGLPSEQRVSLVLYDLSGRVVRRLLEGVMPAGVHRVAWDGRNDAGASVASGPYLLRVKARDATSTRKLTLLK